jgi:channel protein (hemolysin III family)
MKLASLGIFSFASVFMLSMSGVYHLLSPEGLPRLVLQRIDHSAILVLIVSTMTPVHQILFKGFMTLA